jgi:hypothetical protein
MAGLVDTLDPLAVERYVVNALGSVIGHYHECWHILRADDALPALVKFRHVSVSISDLRRLAELRTQAGMPHGYLVSTSLPFSDDLVYFADQISIDLINAYQVENIVREAVGWSSPLSITTET